MFFVYLMFNCLTADDVSLTAVTVRVANFNESVRQTFAHLNTYSL